MNMRGVIVTLVAMLFSIERAAAPIVDEEKATPAPKSKATAKSKAQTESDKTREVKKGASPSQLAGTWTGMVGVLATWRNNSKNYLWDFVITVASDAKTVSTKWKDSSENNWGATIQAPCEGEGNLIRWSVLGQNKKGATSHSFTLELNGNRIATLSYHGQITSGSSAGFTADGNGVITKQ